MIVSIEMVRPLRPILATVFLASGALVTFACSDDAQPVAPTYPTQGDGGSASSTSASSSGGSSGTDTKPDSGSPGAGDGGLACAPLVPQVDVRSVKTEPDPVGGTIMDGTYELTSATAPDDNADGGVVGKKSATLVFSGNKVAWNFDSEMVGQTGERCCVGTWSIVNGVYIKMDVECFSAEGSGSYTSGYDVTNEAGTPQLRLYIGLGGETFTRK